MNKKMLLLFGVLLGVLFILPILVQVVRIMNEPAYVAETPPDPTAPPLLNAENLVGTAWTVKTPELPVAVTITLNAGGQAVATVPGIIAALARQQIGTDTLVGTWHVNGAKLEASMTVKDKTHTVACDIIGDKLYHEGAAIRRVF